MNPAALDAVVAGQDAVIVTLGISENPLGVRYRGAWGTPDDVRSRGTRCAVDAMRRCGVTRLVVQSSFGVGDTRPLLGFADRWFFRLVLAPQIADTEHQEAIVRDSGLDRTIARPVHLVDGDDDGPAFLSESNETRRMGVSRALVARFLVDAVRGRGSVGECVAVSG